MFGGLHGPDKMDTLPSPGLDTRLGLYRVEIIAMMIGMCKDDIKHAIVHQAYEHKYISFKCLNIMCICQEEKAGV